MNKTHKLKEKENNTDACVVSLSFQQKILTFTLNGDSGVRGPGTYEW